MKKVFTALFVVCIFLTACEKNAVKDVPSESNLETTTMVSAFEEKSVTVEDTEETTSQTSDNEIHR